ncbi:hypothetical protein COT95_01415 [Candidatus Falkowbacteria bacterium CG10_big_fil_rev_8_21_14_0_10_37_6]|uniref:VTT domain-containing protein n=1 Tax=Candidatus Falkowbacteria bacterium CG10_big_fil_rev_8_21_14_0_10_37_6 TaxID=1974563 RepID=A0A2H0V757_9BACT|nr:MAG: hypothetical protein COT95_01415 [Candidatus Falkowbacteria bacterium CG10_big_fil_rev_8_21_14_0_10_37_6]
MNYIISLIINNGYLILFPIAAIEGPIVSLAVGFLVSLGYFDFLLAYIILIFGDLVPDIIYYYFGRFGNKQKFVEKYGNRFGLNLQNFGHLENLWHNHGKKVMFLSKLSYGLSTPFLISSGLVNLPFKKFLAYALPVTFLQYAVIMTIGYVLGNSYLSAMPYIQDAGIIILIVAIIFVAGYILFSQYVRRKIIEMEK